MCQNSKGHPSELTELLEGVKIVRGKIKNKKRKKRGYLSESSLPGPVRQEPQNLFSLIFETGPYSKIVF